MVPALFLYFVLTTLEGWSWGWPIRPVARNILCVPGDSLPGSGKYVIFGRSFTNIYSFNGLIFVFDLLTQAGAGASPCCYFSLYRTSGRVFVKLETIFFFGSLAGSGAIPGL